MYGPLNVAAARRIRLGAKLAVGIPALRASDVLLASFPRSGSTLLRFVLTHYALGLAGDPAPVSFERLNRLAPELGASWLWGGPPRGDLPRWVKTHRPYSRALARPRALHLVRAPLDALASYHRYWTARLDAEPVAPGDFLRDGRRGLPRWIAHTRSWRARAELQMRYRDLRHDPAEAVGGALAAYGVQVDRAVLEGAAARSTAEAVRAQEQEGGVAGPDRLRPGAVFVADRPAGEGRPYFADEDRAWAWRRLTEAGMGEWCRL